MEETQQAEAEQQEQEPEVYLNCENNLKKVVNSRATTDNILMFVSAIQDFKNIDKLIDKPQTTGLSYLISKEYLKNLVVGNKRQKSNKISKLLNKAKLKTQLVFRYTKKHNGYCTMKSKEKINLILI